MPHRSRSTGGVYGGDGFTPLRHPHEVNEDAKTPERFLHGEEVKGGLRVDASREQCDALIRGILAQYQMRRDSGSEDVAALRADTREILQALGLVLPDEVRCTPPASMASKQRTSVSYEVWRAAKIAQWEARRRSAKRSALVTGTVDSITDEEQQDLMDHRAQDQRLLRKGVLTAIRILQGQPDDPKDGFEELNVGAELDDVDVAVDLEALRTRGKGLERDQ